MMMWLLAGLGLYLFQIYLPTTLYLPAEGIMNHLGGRDALPEPSKWVGRSRRALANMQENLPIFVTLGLLGLVVPGANLELATQGAAVFVVARVLYLPAYLFALTGVRSAFYLVALGGLGAMLAALV
ncbi:MAG: MAPEG family protein [Myxococcota bacterium]